MYRYRYVVRLPCMNTPRTKASTTTAPPTLSHAHPVTTKLEGRIFEVTLDDDRTRNSLPLHAIEQLQAAMKELPSEARALVLSSTGTTFCSGHNFRELHGITPEQAEHLFNASTELVKTIRNLSVPVIARVQGGAIGAGCMLALACDFIVAGRSAFFQTAGAARGWFCFTPMVTVMHSCAPARAKEMLFSGQKITATQALDWGMINRVVDDTDLVNEATTFAHLVSQGDPEMLRLGKKAFNQFLPLPFDKAMSEAARHMAETSMMPAAQDRIAKALSK